MIRSLFKRILPVALALVTVLSLALSANAADFNLNATGSIKVHLHDSANPDTVIGGALTLYKVADATVADSNLTFVPAGDFAGFGLPLTDLNDPALVTALADYASEQDVEGTEKELSASGTAVYSNLSTGLYLVVQLTTTQEYLPVSPFLVSLPMYDGDAGSWIYSIEASPKVQRPDREPVSLTVVKKWLDNNVNRPKQLSVQLLMDGKAVETVTLTAENDWQHTWKGLDAYHEWSVKEVVPTGYEASYETYRSKVTITNVADWYNKPDDILIQTGQLNWPVPVLACVGLLLVVTGCALLRKGRREV